MRSLFLPTQFKTRKLVDYLLQQVFHVLSTALQSSSPSSLAKYSPFNIRLYSSSSACRIPCSLLLTPFLNATKTVLPSMSNPPAILISPGTEPQTNFSSTSAKSICEYIMFVARLLLSACNPAVSRNCRRKPEMPRKERSIHSLKFDGSLKAIEGMKRREVADMRVQVKA